MAAFEFVVPGVPHGKGRPRFARTKSGKNRTYTPKTTARFEDVIRLCAMNAGAPVFQGPVGVHVRALWPSRRPPLKRGSRPEEWRTARPDLDNLVKAVCDSLNGICYNDDAQVVSIVAQKLRAAQGTPPRTEIKVIEL